MSVSHSDSGEDTNAQFANVILEEISRCSGEISVSDVVATARVAIGTIERPPAGFMSRLFQITIEVCRQYDIMKK